VSGRIDPRFFHLGISWRWVVSFTPRPHNPRWNDLRYPLDKGLGGSQCQSGRYGEMKILDPTGTRTPTPRSSSRSQSLYLLRYCDSNEVYYLFHWHVWVVVTRTSQVTDTGVFFFLWTGMICLTNERVCVLYNTGLTWITLLLLLLLLSLSAFVSVSYQSWEWVSYRSRPFCLCCDW
jgi:hypothetical protein